MSLINCIESVLKSNNESHLAVLLHNYGTTLQLHRIETGTVEVLNITTIADVSGSLDGKYWLLYSPMSSYYVWYSLADMGTDPLVTGKIGIKVIYTEDDIANDIATKTNDALNTMQDFTSTVVDNVLTTTNRITGDATTSTAGTSGFTVDTETAGTDPDANVEYLAVYGKKAGPVSKETYYEITGIVTGDELVPVDDYSAGLFTRGKLYTLDVDTVKTGDTLVMTRADSRQRRYIVLEPQILGTTNSVFKMWMLSAVGD